MQISKDDLLAIEREYCSRSFANFAKRAWHILEPATDLKWGWALDAICEHLEAVTAGEVKRLLINVPPGPLRHDTLVETGRGLIKLSEVIVGDTVLTHKGRYMPVTDVHNQGVQQILKITTNSGRVNYAAPSHPYLTPNGWVAACDLKVGNILGVVNREQDRNKPSNITEDESRFLGYMVGDGSCTHSPNFTNKDVDILDDFIRCAEKIGMKCSRRKVKTFEVIGLTGARDFLKKHNLLGKDSYTKRIPEAVMNGSKRCIESFLGAYWSCDGGIDIRKTNTRGSIFRAYATTVSTDLAEDLVQALGLVGIESRLRKKSRKLETKSQPGGIYKSYSVEVQKEVMTAKILHLPAICERKSCMAGKLRTSFDKVLWDDEIVSIEPDMDALCMCLTVDVDHSFTAAGIAVKNCMKSILTGVLWPAWEWGPKNKPSMRYLGTAHKQDLAVRDSTKCRRLIQSAWYQQRWPIELTGDQNAKTKFENSATGFREAMAFGSMTGSRGDRVLLDDSLSVDNANSEADLKSAEITFTEALPTRVNNDDSAIVVIMQRLNERDTSGIILKRDLGYTHLCLPMRFEADRRCTTSIGFVDPRTSDGELLFPERFSEAMVSSLEKTMGSYAAAGQLQQRPAPREGGMFKKAWFQIVRAIPAGTKFVRGWDLAATEGAGDWTAGVKIGRQKDGRFIICDVVRDQKSAAGVERLLVNTASQDGYLCEQSLPQDPGQAGKQQAAYYIGKLAGYTAHATTESGDKETRSNPLSAQAEAGNVDILEGDWNEAFFDELCVFPNAEHDDQVDAASRAFNTLAIASSFNLEAMI